MRAFIKYFLVLLALYLLSPISIDISAGEPQTLEDFLGSKSGKGEKVEIHSDGSKNPENKRAPQDTSNDPKNKGWYEGQWGSKERIKWNPRTTDCEPCKELVNQYNETGQDLYHARYSLENELDRRKDDKKQMEENMRYNSSKDEEAAAKNIAYILQYDEDSAAREAYYKRAIEFYEKLLNELANQIAACEKTCKEGTKTSGIAIGSSVTGSVVGFPEKLESVTTDCPPCAKLAADINNTIGILYRELIALKHLELELESSKMAMQHIKNRTLITDDSVYGEAKKNVEANAEKVKKQQNRIDNTKKHIEKVKGLLAACEEEHCPKVGACPQPPAHHAMTVGSNGEVGSGARLKEKVGDTAKGLVGGFGLGGGTSFGIGGGGNKAMRMNRDMRNKRRASKGPDTEDDPIDESDKVKSEKSGTELALGATCTDDGILISSAINDSDDNGTYQTVFMEDEAGRRLLPKGYFIYDLWADWKLTVSWTYDRWVDGQHVEHKSGGWEDTWREDLGSGKLFADNQNDGLWNQLGFDNASHGINGLGAEFPVNMAEISQHQLYVATHITQPSKDPVSTIPFIHKLDISIPEGKPATECIIKVTPVLTTLASTDC